MRDERGELRGLLIVLGLVMALGAVVFGFNLRAGKSEPAAAKVTAGATTTLAPGAPTTTVAPADASGPAPTGSPAPAPSPGATTPRTPSAPVTSPPATAPPATSPPATSPPATAPPATAAPPTTTPFSCTFSLSDTNPASAEKVTMTIQSSSPNRRFSFDRYVNGKASNSGGSSYQTDTAGRFTATFSVLEHSGDQVRLVVGNGACEGDYTVK